MYIAHITYYVFESSDARANKVIAKHNMYIQNKDSIIFWFGQGADFKNNQTTKQ